MTSALFSPIRLAELELPNRVVISPMCQYSARDGCMTDWHLTHLGSLSNSGASLLVFEATAVERHGRISHGDLGLYDDDCEAALARVVAHCRRIGSTKLGIQIGHAGRKASAQRPWEGGRALSAAEDPWQTIAPSPIALAPGWPTPHEMTLQDIARVREAHAEAAG
ncbi:MAG TPA: oxidoreductase, partial [Beijerinckiaceae bacterium]|nr:oxidoreductase [Beijerinckiaceae bacterium]